MEKRLKEIQDRKLEIRSALTGNQELNLDEVQAELINLEKEEREIRSKQDIASKINVGKITATEIKKPEDEKRTMENNKFDSVEYRNAFMEYTKTGVMAPEFRSVAMTADNGAVIPTTTLNKIVEKLETYGNILPLVTRTAYQTGIAIPTSNVKPVASWVAESATSPIQNKKTGSITFGHFKLRCAVGMSLEMSVMSLSAFEAAIVNNITEAMVKAIEASIISGDGNGKPSGILEATPAETISVAKFDYKTMVSIEGEVPEAYDNGSVYFMSKKTFYNQFVGATDSNGQPVARTNFGVTGTPEHTLFGRKVVFTNYLPAYDSAAAGETFAFIFRPEDYTLNTTYSIALKQYEDNLTDDIVRKAIMIVDGKVIDSNSLVTLTKPEA